MARVGGEDTQRDPTGFDVTCVIGRVEFGASSMTPVEAAFALIGRHNAEGNYSFPHESGGTVVVQVTHEIPL